MTQNPDKVSVVIPFYNEGKNIHELFPRLMSVLEHLGRPFEVLCVDDGSRDRSLILLQEMAERYSKRVRIIELARNFGQHPAILAAFRYVTGRSIITLDADLQNPPEEIPKILALLDQGYDVVGGVRQARKDSLFRKFASGLVNRVTVIMTRLELRDFGCMLRGYSREIVDQINKCEENSTFIPALGLLFARRPIEIPVKHAPRGKGHSQYSLYRLIRLNFDLMTGFSVVPLQLFTLFGFLVSCGGMSFGIYLFVRRYILLRASEAEGVFTLLALAFILIGILMAGVGVLGEYIGRIYQEVRGRPRFLVRHVYGSAAPIEKDEVRV